MSTTDLRVVIGEHDFPPHPDLAPVPPGPPPEATLSAVRSGVVVARAATWSRAPSLDGRRVGLIGQYAADDDTSGVAVLGAACEHLRREGCDMAVGPVDGSTWFSYRLVTDAGSEAPFLLEPRNPPAYPAQWALAGFRPGLTYVSSVATPDTVTADPRAAELRSRFAHVTLRGADPAHTERDLRGVHALSLRAFEPNPLYAPLPWEAFEALYRPLLARAPLEWVWLAEAHGDLLGYVFAYPDLLRAAPGAHSDTLVVKTVAVRPGRDTAGLGRLLVHELHERAFAGGFTRVVHALMHDGNRSLNLSQRLGRVIRRYAVFTRALDGASMEAR